MNVNHRDNVQSILGRDHEIFEIIIARMTTCITDCCSSFYESVHDTMMTIRSSLKYYSNSFDRFLMAGIFVVHMYCCICAT